MPTKQNPDKSAKLEAKADDLLGKGKIRKAIEKYREALDLDPTRKILYDKFMKAHDEMPDDWKMEDFVESVNCAMKLQEQENPPIKQVHAMLSPEWNGAYNLALKILAIEDEGESKLAVEELVGMGEIGTRAAVSLLLKLRSSAKNADEDKAEEDDNPIGDDE